MERRSGRGGKSPLPLPFSTFIRGSAMLVAHCPDRLVINGPCQLPVAAMILAPARNSRPLRVSSSEIVPDIALPEASLNARKSPAPKVEQRTREAHVLHVLKSPRISLLTQPALPPASIGSSTTSPVQPEHCRRVSPPSPDWCVRRLGATEVFAKWEGSDLFPAIIVMPVQPVRFTTRSSRSTRSSTSIRHRRDQNSGSSNG